MSDQEKFSCQTTSFAFTLWRWQHYADGVSVPKYTAVAKGMSHQSTIKALYIVCLSRVIRDAVALCWIQTAGVILDVTSGKCGLRPSFLCCWFFQAISTPGRKEFRRKLSRPIMGSCSWLRPHRCTHGLRTSPRSSIITWKHHLSTSQMPTRTKAFSKS